MFILGEKFDNKNLNILHAYLPHKLPNDFRIRKKRDSVTNVEYTYAKLPVPTHETVLGIFILVFETNAMISVYRTIKVEVFK